MVNYKGSTRKIIITGLELNVPSNGTVKLLRDAVAADTAADGFIDDSDNLIYAVTTGKTYRILGLGFRCASAGVETVVISSGDTENAETATLITLRLPYTTELFWIPVDLTLAAAKFLTYNPSSSGINEILAIGYEY